MHLDIEGNLYNFAKNQFTMKHCPNCGSEVEDSFDLCWNCNYHFSEGKVVDIAERHLLKKEIDCLRCHVPMSYAGNYKFHEGQRLGFFGNLFEFFVTRQSFDLYVCPKCGKVEFFVPQ